MKRSELVRHMKKHGCVLARQGGRHEIWENSKTGSEAAVPRHDSLKRGTARQICKDLEIPSPF
jgi:mRNA interferase HicA